jgi:hypothetical protein
MKNEPLHKCAAPHCDRQIRDGLLMCPAHWARVPYSTQRDLLNAWKRGSAKKYLRARAECIRTVSLPIAHRPSPIAHSEQ